MIMCRYFHSVFARGSRANDRRNRIRWLARWELPPSWRPWRPPCWSERAFFAIRQPISRGHAAEVFRGAILDALAHEFKTPLATIVTAAGGLREDEWA